MDGVGGSVCFAAREISLMQYQDNNYFVFDAQIHRERLTCVRGSARTWQHYHGNGAIGLSAVVARFDSPFVLYVETCDYERRLSGLTEAYCTVEGDVPRLLLRLICND